MEFIFYIVLLIVTFISCFSYKVINVYSGFFAFIFLIMYMLVVRYNNFDADMETYAVALSMDWESISAHPYYLRESFFWLGGNWLYNNVTQSAELTFVLFDGLCIFLMIRACQNYKLSVFYVFLFYSCFPSVMGYNNIYRQFIGTCFTIYVFSLVYSGGGWFKRGYYVFSIMSHNMTSLFFPLIFFRRKTVFCFLGLIGVLCIYYFFSHTKSHNTHTGLSLNVAYFLLIIALSLFLMMDRESRFVAIYSLLSSMGLFFLFEDARYERFSMFIIQVMLAFLCILVSKKCSPPVLGRMILFFLLCVPVFLFEGARQFIL